MSDRVATLRLDTSVATNALKGGFGADLDGNLKIRATKNADGSVTLFATSRATGWWGQLTGSSRERDTARDALQTWFKQKFGPVLAPETKQVLDARLKSGELNLAGLRTLIADVERLQAQGHDIPRDGKVKGDKLTLAGETYTVGKQLGKGGFGTVHLAETDGGKKVAIKQVNPGVKPDQAQQEYDAHRRAMGDGSNTSHITQLTGVVVNPKGQVTGIVTEAMASDGHDAMNKVNAAERRGTITKTEAHAIRLTMLKDMATGLGQLHDVKGVMHRDVKPENFLVSGDGVTKVADFGTVAPESDQRGQVLTGGATIVYMAPEALKEGLEVVRLNEKIDKLRERAILNMGTKQAVKDLARIDDLTREVDTHSITSKSDVFSLGLSAMAILESRVISSDEQRAMQRLQVLGEGTQTERNQIFTYLGINTSSPEHQLIRSMLSARPEDRPDATTVANSPPLDGPDVGTPATRKLLAEVLDGTR